MWVASAGIIVMRRQRVITLIERFCPSFRFQLVYDCGDWINPFGPARSRAGSLVCLVLPSWRRNGSQKKRLSRLALEQDLLTLMEGPFLALLRRASLSKQV